MLNYLFQLWNPDQRAFCEPQFTYISVTVLFTSNTHFQDRHTHFYDTFACSDMFLTNQAQRLWYKCPLHQVPPSSCGKWGGSPSLRKRANYCLLELLWGLNHKTLKCTRKTEQGNKRTLSSCFQCDLKHFQINRIQNVLVFFLFWQFFIVIFLFLIPDKMLIWNCVRLP